MKKIKLNYLSVVSIVAVIICLLCAVMFLSFITASKYDKINHFDNIDVCKTFDEYIVEEQIFDKYITDIAFIDSYVHLLNYKGKQFSLYAYQFESVDVAKKYYSAIKGKTVDGDIDYQSNSSLFSSNLIARYKTNVYRIETGGTQDYVEIMKFINSVFTVNIR